MVVHILRFHRYLPLLPLLLWLALSTQSAGAQTTDTVRILVKSDPAVAAGVSVMAAGDAAHDLGLGWLALEVPAGQAAQTLAELQADSTVVEATLDYPLEVTVSPDDPAYTAGDQWSFYQIGADLAWEFSQGEGVVVAVIDSGVDPSHPDLADRLVPGYSFISDDTDTSDQCGHGTHVAGIVAAAGNNGVGGIGVAYRAQIMPVQVMNADCSGTYSRLMQGILYAVDAGADIIVIASGGGFDHSGLHEAVQTARQRGVLVVVSAGNRGNDEPFYPGSYAEAYTVAGTAIGDAVFDKSTFGPQIDISAPATRILSTYVNAAGESTYAYMSGTSMSAPHVAGLAALVLALDPELSLDDLEATLNQTADDLGDPGMDVHFGHGRINAWRAVWAVSPASGNLRPGHARIPTMAELRLEAASTTAVDNGIMVEWRLGFAIQNAGVVVYRAPVPDLAAAVDIGELPAISPAGTPSGAYLDSAVTPGNTYYYWLVLADREVETAVSPALAAVAALAQPAPTTGLLLPFVQAAAH